MPLYYFKTIMYLLITFLKGTDLMKKMKRILALLGALFFIILYAFTLIVAIFDFPYKVAVLQTCIYSTLFIALFIASFTAVLNLLKKLNGSDQSEK